MSPKLTLAGNLS